MNKNFSFCNIGQDIWFKIDQIRNIGITPSKIGIQNTHSLENTKEYNLESQSL